MMDGDLGTFPGEYLEPGHISYHFWSQQWNANARRRHLYTILSQILGFVFVCLIDNSLLAFSLGRIGLNIVNTMISEIGNRICKNDFSY